MLGIGKGKRTLRVVVIALLVAAVALPLFNAFVIYPAFTRIVRDKTALEAVRVALHLKASVVDSNGAPSEAALNTDELMLLKEEFGLPKLKLYNATGRVVFSSDASDIGKVNREFYFHEIVARGSEYAKLIRKDSRTLEGEVFRQDVVETYVPLMHGAEFKGAFEIYYDVTPTMSRLRRLAFAGTAASTGIMVFFAVVVVALLRQADRMVELVKQSERDLGGHRDRLEETVQERTSALKAAYAELEREIAERTEASRAMRESERFLNSIFESINDPICIFDPSLAIVRANTGYARLKGRSVETLIGNHCFRVLEGLDAECPDCVVRATFSSGHPCAKQKRVLLPDGTEAWVEIFTYPIVESGPSPSFVVEYTRDVTLRVKAEHEKKLLIKELEELSRADSLTGLLNRRAVNARLSEEHSRSRRYGSHLSVVICDIDEFKSVNDSRGHAAGDAALVSVASCISASLRDADAAGRYGGDEFIVIMPETSLQGAAQFAERLREKIAGEEIELQGRNTFKVTISLGVASLSPSDNEYSDLVIRADSALYTSKQAGKNRVTYKEA